jgi:hypothetical protein
MERDFRKMLGVVLVLAILLPGCAAVGAGAGGYAGYELGCDEDRSKEECAAATGAGAIGGAAIGGAVD